MPEQFRFLVDEGALRQAANGGTSGLTEAFECLAAIIEALRAHSIGKHSGVWEEEIGEHPLCNWLFDPALGVDRVAAKALQIALDRTPDWDAAWDTTELPTQASIGGVMQHALSVAAATRETQEARATGCLSALVSHSGRLPVVVAGRATDLHFIAVPRDALAFFREVPEVESLDEHAYFENAQHAFPSVHFVLERARFGQFEERYETIRAKVTAHLAVLNDHARAILETAEPAGAKEGRFGSHGIDASGESPLTRADGVAMRQREVNVAGRVVVCDWHTKIRRHIDRIYFNATSSDRVVVGIFHDHLD